jgi:pimeloyl-ACP methyl ester carboxylesterase
MCDARLFGPQIAAFSGLRPVHLATIAGADRVEALAAALLRAAPLRFALAGLSMGGIVAMEALRQAPDRVERIALLDTNPLAETPEVAARREPQIARARAGRLAEVVRDELAPLYLAAGSAAATSSTSSWRWPRRSAPRSSSASPGRCRPAPTRPRRCAPSAARRSCSAAPRTGCVPSPGTS